MRSPVNDPGPFPMARAVRALRLTLLAFKSSSMSKCRRSACWCFSLDSSQRATHSPSGVARAIEQFRVDVSKRRIMAQFTEMEAENPRVELGLSPADLASMVSPSLRRLLSRS